MSHRHQQEHHSLHHRPAAPEQHHRFHFHPTPRVAARNHGHTQHQEKPPTLLCVDDSPQLLHLRSQILSLHGYRVVATTWPHEALAMLRRIHFNAVVTDFDMPEMNGEEFVQRVRHLDQEKPVLLHSASSSLPSALLNSVDGYVKKGDSVETFLQGINSVVQKRRAQLS